MNTRFIDFEGIHGCGKTATAWILNKNLHDLGVKSKLFFEADMDAPYENPCDLTFMSAFSYSEFTWLLDSFPEQAARIKSSAKKLDDYYLLFYPDFYNESKELTDILLKNQAYEGRLCSITFTRLMLQRINDFVHSALKDETIYIFESVIFQHIINELLRFGKLTEEEVSGFISEAVNALKPLNPVLFHLRTNDINGNIDKIARERLSDNLELYPDWIDYMVQYVRDSDYGRINNVKNREDVIEYFKARAEVENIAFDLLDARKYVLEIDHMSKDELNESVLNKVMEG